MRRYHCHKDRDNAVTGQDTHGTYSVMMATFEVACPDRQRQNTMNGHTVQRSQRRNSTFADATFGRVSINDDDGKFNDARGLSFSDPTGQTLTEHVTFGSDAGSDADVRAADEFHS